MVVLVAVAVGETLTVLVGQGQQTKAVTEEVVILMRFGVAVAVAVLQELGLIQMEQVVETVVLAYRQRLQVLL